MANAIDSLDSSPLATGRPWILNETLELLLDIGSGHPADADLTPGKEEMRAISC
jgi:hypothetical protein